MPSDCLSFLVVRQPNLGVVPLVNFLEITGHFAQAASCTVYLWAYLTSQKLLNYLPIFNWCLEPAPE